MNNKFLIFSLLVFVLFSCKNEQKKQTEQSSQQNIELLDTKNFTDTIDGAKVSLYTLKSANGITMQVTNLGGRVVTLWVPDKNGVFDDVVLGHKTLQEYIDCEGGRFIGCVVGRYANRIADGQFVLDGKTYNVPKNNNGQSLHGGLKGLDLVVWNVDKVTDNEIEMSYVSPDGEDGYPGTLNLKMTYMLTDEEGFKIVYSATTDKPTVINLSHHGFFNLKGEGKGTINDHQLTINADYIVPVNEKQIPTGELMAVAGTPFDFKVATLIGERVGEENEQLKNGKGYDHNWVLNRKTEKDVEFAASVYEPVSGRCLEVWTDQPGMQFYGGNALSGKGNGKYGVTFNYREALALETQHFPDSPNQPKYPTTRLNPGEKYTQTCIYKFTVK